MILTRKLIMAHTVIVFYALGAIAIHFLLRLILNYLRAEGLLAMALGAFYYGSTLLLAAFPLVSGIAGAYGSIVECKARGLSSVVVGLIGLGAGVLYVAAGCLIVYILYRYTYPGT